MQNETARFVVAEAMQLHNERLERASEDVRRLRAELQAAEIRQAQARDAWLNFRRYVEQGTA